MRPLVVTARLSGGIALPNGPLALDALLMAARAARDGLPPLSVVGLQNAVDLEIPIARSECGRLHLASFAQYAVDETEASWISRKFPIPEAQMLGEARFKRVNISAGAQKSYRLPLELIHVVDDTLTWWCVGDAEGLRELLLGVTHLGKRRAAGKGRVVQWAVEPCEPWPGFPVLRDGRPTRTLPLDWPGLEDYDRAFRVLTPPYWDHAREQECAIPIAEDA